MTQALRRKCEPWVPELRYGGCGCTLESCMGWHRHWHSERWVAESGVGNCARHRFATLMRLSSVSRRSEPSAQTGGELHGVRTAAARRGGERPVLGCRRRDTGERPLTELGVWGAAASLSSPSCAPLPADPGGLCRWDSEALQHRRRQVPEPEAVSWRGGHVPRPRPGRRVRPSPLQKRSGRSENVEAPAGRPRDGDQP